MKVRLLALLLVAALLLAACAPSNLGGTEGTAPSTSPTQSTSTTAPTQPTEPPIPTVDEVINCTYETKGGTPAFANFLCPNYEIDKISVTRTSPDGTKTVMNLSRRGKEDFVYKAGDTTLHFRYLVYRKQAGTDTDNFDFLEYALMANDPNATYLDTLDEKDPSAVIIYAEYQDFTDELAERYGAVPESAKKLAALDPYFLVRVRDPLDTTFFIEEENFGTHHRYDYDGNLLCSVEGNLDHFRELPDGGFVAALRTPYPAEGEPHRRYASIVCYDKDGNQIWEYTPVNDDGEYSLIGSSDLISEVKYHNDQIYAFSESMAIYILSTDGNLISFNDHLKMPSFSKIVPTEQGFTGYGYGSVHYDTGIPAPEGETGNFEFIATMDFDGNIIDIEYPDIRFYEIQEAGVLGQVIYIDDPIFTPNEKDKLPDSKTVVSRLAYDTEDGYVLIRVHKFSKNCDMYVLGGSKNNPYCELILTGYDKDGNPLWQTTSPVFGPLKNHFPCIWAA